MDPKYFISVLATFVVCLIGATCVTLPPQLLAKLDHLGGERCNYTAGERDLNGTCKFMLFCNTAMSDAIATGKPQLCSGHEYTACCPNEPRISEKKCKEYGNYISPAIMPLLPVDMLENATIPAPVCKNTFGAILHGEDAHEGEFPHMVALGYGDDANETQWMCGGALISEDFILTAAHCVDAGGTTGLVQRVLLGALKLSDLKATNQKNGGSKVTVIDVEGRFKHPNFRSDKAYNDIALLKLKDKVTLNPFVRPACLPQPNLRLEKKRTSFVTGWGRNTSEFSIRSDVLQKVALSIQPSKSCGDAFSGDPYVSEGIKISQICAGDPEHQKDSCRGDSGGPMTVTVGNMTCVYYTIGVVSMGASECGQTVGVYTKVQYYLDWIESIVWPVEQDTSDDIDLNLD